MTKQDVIKQAWGEHYSTVKEHLTENGWVNNKKIGKDAWDGYKGIEVDTMDNYSAIYCFYKRPKSISGIEDNRGWLPLDTSVPNIHSSYFVCDIKQKDRIDIFTGNLLALTGDYTHYQHINKPGKPLW